jgi:hypothetical protein
MAATYRSISESIIISSDKEYITKMLLSIEKSAKKGLFNIKIEAPKSCSNYFDIKYNDTATTKGRFERPYPEVLDCVINYGFKVTVFRKTSLFSGRDKYYFEIKW